jgi:small subunit ribosomal protein S9
MAKEENTTKKEVVKKEKKTVAAKKPAAAKKAPVKKVAVKKAAPKKEVVSEVKKETVFTGKYFSTIGRRKTAVARVRMYENGKNQITVNGKDYRDYFPMETMQKKVRESLDKMKLIEKFDISVVTNGGGIDSQAEAIRHGIARALIKLDENLKKRLRKEGLLTRDSRMKERKKFGLKRARKAPQWSKR